MDKQAECEKHWENIWHAEHTLDAIDAFLNFLKGDV